MNVYNRLCAIVLFPVRIILFIILLIIFYIIALLNRYYETPQIYKFFVDRLLDVLGVNVYVSGVYNPNAKITIANHINMIDIAIIGYLECKFPCFIMNERFANMYIINEFYKVSNSIKCSRYRRTNTVEEMKDRIEKGNNLIIYPDRCDIIPEGKYIAPFRSGAFVLKEDIQPIIIRYVPSYSTNINWNNNTVLSLLFSILLDGHIVAHVKILPTVTYKFNSIEEYKLNTYDRMEYELKFTESQYPPRINKSIYATDENYTYIYITLILLSYLLGNIEHAFYISILYISQYNISTTAYNNVYYIHVLLHYMLIYNFCNSKTCNNDLESFVRITWSINSLLYILDFDPIPYYLTYIIIMNNL